jgi:hypothetical protein
MSAHREEQPVPHHLNDAIAQATGAIDAADLVARTEGDPILAPIAKAVAQACDRIAAAEKRLTDLAGIVRAAELHFSVERDGAGDEPTLLVLGRAADALREITALYGTRLRDAEHFDVLLELFAAADQGASRAHPGR